MPLKSAPCPPPPSVPQSASIGASKNRSHYVRDASSKTTAASAPKPGHFARFRSFALNILRANGITANVSRELYLNALNPNHPIAYRSA
ncbi:MAG: hypothetical protein U1E43_06860 [Rhodospirillales bacterium]